MADKTILIIDDAEVIHESVKDLLEDTSYKIISAFNGKEGLELTRKYSPDLILLDLRMPIKSGLQFLAELKQNPSGTPSVIVISDYGTAEVKTMAYQLGGKFYLNKPLDMDDLRALVHFELMMER